MSRVGATLVAAFLFVVAGCGGDGNPAEIMRETAAELGSIESADPFTLRFTVDPRDGDEFGFAIDGAVALCDGSSALPRLDVAYTRFAQGEEFTARVISDGKNAFIELDGQAYEFGDEQEAELRSACEELSTEGGGLEQLDVGDWTVDAEADGEDRVEGRLDVVAVTNDLVDVARAFGGSGVSRLDADDARRIAEATEDSTFELERGDDGLLRRLLLEADLGFDVPDDLREVLGDVVGAKVTIELELENVNERFEVDVPENAKPATELPGS